MRPGAVVPTTARDRGAVLYRLVEPSGTCDVATVITAMQALAASSANSSAPILITAGIGPFGSWACQPETTPPDAAAFLDAVRLLWAPRGAAFVPLAALEAARPSAAAAAVRDGVGAAVECRALPTAREPVCAFRASMRERLHRLHERLRPQLEPTHAIPVASGVLLTQAPDACTTGSGSRRVASGARLDVVYDLGWELGPSADGRAVLQALVSCFTSDWQGENDTVTEATADVLEAARIGGGSDASAAIAALEHAVDDVTPVGTAAKHDVAVGNMPSHTFDRETPARNPAERGSLPLPRITGPAITASACILSAAAVVAAAAWQAATQPDGDGDAGDTEVTRLVRRARARAAAVCRPNVDGNEGVWCHTI